MEQNKDKNISQASDRNTANIIYCAEVDVKNIQAKKLNKFNTTMLYPYHNVNGKVEPILTQTKSIILQNNATYNRNIKYYSDSDKKFIYIKRSLEKNDETMDELFEFCHRLDKHMEENRDSVLEESSPSMIKKVIENGGRTYNKLVTTDLQKGCEWIKLKLNAFVNTSTDDIITKPDITVTQNDLMVRIFYRNDVIKSKSDKWKDHKLSDLPRTLRANTKMRFILSVNKLWYNAYNYGLHIKVEQMEIDETLSQRFQILKKLKENNKNMFAEETSKKMHAMMENRNIYGMSKNKIEVDNKKIITLIKNNSSKSLFDDTEYAPPTSHFNIEI